MMLLQQLFVEHVLIFADQLWLALPGVHAAFQRPLRLVLMWIILWSFPTILNILFIKCCYIHDGDTCQSFELYWKEKLKSSSKVFPETFKQFNSDNFFKIKRQHLDTFRWNILNSRFPRRGPNLIFGGFLLIIPG